MTDNTENNTITNGKKRFLSPMAMTLLMVTTVFSLRGLASQAEYGYTSILYYVIAALVFLIPFSMVCAELGSTYHGHGGLFRWCSEAFGPRWGWAAMCYEWLGLLVWFPSVLMFGAVALAYVFWPDSFDSHFSNNKLYVIIVVLSVYWLATFNMFRGDKASKRLSAAGGLLGTIVPGIVLVAMGVIYLCQGNHNYIDANVPFFPDFTNFSTIVLAASIFLFFGGMEIYPVHVNQMRNPAREFPKSMLMAVLIIVLAYVMGTLAIGFTTPKDKINLLGSLFYAYNQQFQAIGMSWMGNVIAALITFGVIGQIAAVIDGAASGILSVGDAGYLPRTIQKRNRHDMPVPLLWIQGIIVTILTSIMIFLPSVESAYQILSQMSTVIYLLLVIIIYAAFVRLRRTDNARKRGFRVPGGNVGKWITATVGIFGAIVALVLSCLPPSQIDTGSKIFYVSTIVVGTAIFCALPFVIFAFRKPQWRNPDTHFEPFNFELENRKPSEISNI